MWDREVLYFLVRNYPCPLSAPLASSLAMMTKPRKGRLPLLAVRVTREWAGGTFLLMLLEQLMLLKKFPQVLFLLLLPPFLLLLLKLKLLLLQLFLLLLLLYGSY